ncbi:hemerythrin domain-containing protein [Kitasatospora sp. NPDC127111]|uniref:hemerythrin domain-containing protein n=1 Tax=Kitasatospora sp. NPDC127111 TaxID=3345363 RepID=UPI00363BE547
MNGAEGFPSRLFAEHRAIEALLRQLDGVAARGGTANGGTAGDEGVRLVALLRQLLEPHMVAEEAYLYPLVRRCLPAGAALAVAAGRTHAAIRRLLDRADDTRLSAAERRRATAAMVVVLRAHLRGEEEQLFPALRARGAPEELRRCDRRMGEARARRPGAQAPGAQAAGAQAAGAEVWGLPPGAGAIAALRDHVTGHDTSGHRHSP